jgi:hypothetical protein
LFDRKRERNIVIIVNHNNFRERREDIHVIDISISEGLIHHLCPVRIIQRGRQGRKWNIPSAKKMHSRNVVRKIWIGCRLVFIGTNNNVIRLVVWFMVMVSKNEIGRATRLVGIIGDTINDRLRDWEFIPMAALDDLASDETQEIVGALEIACGP